MSEESKPRSRCRPTTSVRPGDATATLSSAVSTSSTNTARWLPDSANPRSAASRQSTSQRSTKAPPCSPLRHSSSCSALGEAVRLRALTFMRSTSIGKSRRRLLTSCPSVRKQAPCVTRCSGEPLCPSGASPAGSESGMDSMRRADAALDSTCEESRELVRNISAGEEEAFIGAVYHVDKSRQLASSK